jgi:hypothetical protein
MPSLQNLPLQSNQPNASFGTNADAKKEAENQWQVWLKVLDTMRENWCRISISGLGRYMRTRRQGLQGIKERKRRDYSS